MSAAVGRDAVGRGRRPWLPGWAWGLVALLCVALALFVLAKIAPFGQGRKDPRVHTAAGAQGWRAAPAPLNTTPDRPEATPPATPAALPEPPKPPPPEPSKPPAVPAVIAYSAPAMAGGDSGRRSGAAFAGTRVADGAGADGAGEGRGGEATELERRMRATQLPTMRPRRQNVPTTFLLAKNTGFDCLAAEPIDSRMVGTLSCVVQEPGVWNVDGTTRLMPPGTEVNGVMDRGITPGSGERRVWFNWTDARWPKPRRDVHFPLVASGTDLMGQSGVPGDYDSRLGERVKEAAVVSFIDIATGAASGGLATLGGGNVFNLGQVGQRGGSLAQMAYERDRNIQPSVARGPGYMMKVKVMADIDLSDHFRLTVLR